MSEELADIQARIAHYQTIRKVAYWPRTLGFSCCLVGVILLTYATYKIPGGPRSSFGFVALGVIGVGWVLMIYSMIARSRYVRANPYESKA